MIYFEDYNGGECSATSAANNPQIQFDWSLYQFVIEINSNSISKNEKDEYNDFMIQLCEAVESDKYKLLYLFNCRHENKLIRKFCNSVIKKNINDKEELKSEIDYIMNM